MISKSGYAKAKRYVESHISLSEREINRVKKQFPGPCITISRQGGIDIQPLCEKIMNDLGESYSADWAYFDKELLQKVIEDHHLPDRVQKFLNEEKRPVLNQMLNELLGIHPPIMELIHRMTRTILNLAEFGNVILVGRGSNLITSHLSNAVHFRFISPLNKRIEDLQNRKNISRDWAQKIIMKEDENRKGFLQRVFKKDIDDPAIYHAVINLSKYSEKELISTIETIVKNKLPVNKKFNVVAEISGRTKVN